MKILFFTCFFQQGYGVGLVIKKQLEGLLANGFKELYLAVGDFDEKENALLGKSIKISKVGEDYQSVKELMLNVRPDIVIVHTPPYWSHIARFNEFFTIKIAYDHGEPFPGLFSGRERRERENSDMLKYNEIPNYQIHISISGFINRCSGIPNSKVIYNGADHVSDGKDESEINIRDYLGIDKSTFIISSLSRIGIPENHYKNFDCLIQIKKMVLTKLGDKNIVFLIMGKSVPKGNEVEEKIKKAGFLFLENVEEHVKIELLKQSDIFISPSLWEGFNLPLVEAQYMGVPSLCFSIGAHPEVCPFHFGNVDEMVNFIELLYNDDKLRRKYGQTCQRYVRKKFKWENNVNELISILSEAVLKKSILYPLKYQNTKNTSSLKTISNHLSREKFNASLTFSSNKPRIKYDIDGKPEVKIIILAGGKLELLDKNINSIFEKSTYDNFKILVADNSTNEQTQIFLKQIKERYSNSFDFYKNDLKPFNFSALNNVTVEKVDSPYIILLNDDIEVITNDWIESMLEYAQRKDVGVVGCKLLYPNNKIQHAGIIFGVHGFAGLAFNGINANSNHYFDYPNIVRNVSAVTFACAMIKTKIYKELGGLDGVNFKNAFNDTDFCLRAIEKGYLVIYTPYAVLYHHESATRKDVLINPGEDMHAIKKWGKIIEHDPFYNPNLTRVNEDYSIKI